jgi:methyl-accepting chemotaxis protein
MASAALDRSRRLGATKSKERPMRLANLPIAQKLALGFACILAVFAVVSVAIFSALARCEDAAAATTAANALIVDLEQLVAARYDQSQTARGYIITHVERHAGLYAEATKLFAETLARARSDAPANGPEAVEAIARVADAAALWERDGGNPEVELTRDSATADKAIEIAKSTNTSNLMKSFRAEVVKARALAATGLKNAGEAQAAALALAKNAELAGGVVAILCSLLVGWALYRSIARPIAGMTKAMGTLAAGDTDLEIPARGRSDELGLMAAAVENFKLAAIEKRRLDGEAEAARSHLDHERARRERQDAEQRRAVDEVVALVGAGLARFAAKDLSYRMPLDIAEAFRKLPADFNRAIAQLEEAMLGVADKMAAINGGTQEITTAASDLSRRTEQQAASLEETAAALDEVTATVKKAASGALQAREIVVSAKTNAERSSIVVGKAVEAMGDIAKSSQAITQIIGVIDEIAFQTNLLALNAGVEAARAGDAGRGFAVVASEVRALAQRSADAAKEIKSLIQTSTNQVSQGVALVAETGQSLEQIMAQVAEINQVVEEIAARSQEQSTSLEEINTAINQMDRMTQQNAAMVEESTAASHTMAHETGELADLIGQFQIGRMAGAEAPARRRA